MSDRRLPLKVLAAALLAAVAVGTLFLWDNEGDAGRHRVAAGGFELTLPRGWTTMATQDPSLWFRASFQRLQGLPTAWLWLSRWTAGEESMREEFLRDSIGSDGGEVSAIEDIHIAGRPGKSVRYRIRSERVPRWIPAPRLEVVAYYVADRGQLYQLGFSSWPSPPRDTERVLKSLRLFEPVGWRTLENQEHGFRVSVPASWNSGGEDRVPGGLLAFASATTSPEGWLYVIRWSRPEDSLHEAVKLARQNIESVGGQILAEAPDDLGGHEATRLQFLQPADHPDTPAMAHNMEWFVKDDRGRVLILAVGRNDPASTIADDIAARFKLVPAHG